MRKNWLLSLFIAILALPFFSSAAFAEDAVVYEDGEYTITAKAINADTRETSGAAGFLNEDATLTIKDGTNTLLITVPHNDMAEITGLQIEGSQPVVTEGGTGKYMAFTLANLKSELNAQVQYEVPALNMKHDVPFKFVLEGLDAIPVVEEEPTKPEEQPTEPEEQDEAEEPSETTEPEQPVADEGEKVENTNPALTPEKAYTINYVSESNSVNRQFNNPAALLYKNGETYIQMTGTGGQFIESLTINGKEVTWGEKNADGTFTFQFKVEGSLSEVLDFGMVINAGPRGTMEHVVDLSFAESTQQAADINDFALLPINNEKPSEGNNPVTDEDPADKEESANEDKNKPKAPAKKDQLVPDKAYEISFVFKHETEDKTSAADSFFVKPAILLEKDGDRYVQITVTASEYVDSLKNKFGELVVVRENADGSVVYQFKLDGNISDAILLDMVITVPGIYEGQEHKARLFLDESSMKEIDANAYKLAASTNENGPTVDGMTGKQNNDTTTPEKPKFGSNDNDASANQLKAGGKATNPQTGDTTNIMLYVLLLIGSAIPLTIKLRRRFA